MCFTLDIHGVSLEQPVCLAQGNGHSCCYVGHANLVDVSVLHWGMSSYVHTLTALGVSVREWERESVMWGG